MRIGVDASTWTNRRGFGRFTRELLEAMVAGDKINEYTFFIDSQTAGTAELPSQVKKIIVETKVSPLQAASASGRRTMSDLWAMSREVYRHKLDVFFFPAVYSYYPVFNRSKIVVTIHDVIADHHPELVFPNQKLKFFWKLKQNVAVRQADLILTVSDYSKQQIKEYFKLPESRLKVISEAARSVFTTTTENEKISQTLAQYKLKRNEKFLLYVGGISPHKNLSTLLEAFQLIVSNPDASDVKLVFVGDYKDDPFFSAYPSLKTRIAELKLVDSVIFTGFIDDKELVCLYNTAAAVVLPAFEEGFGLPAIEAMACGAPVIASNRGSLPEVIGVAGRFFDPSSKESMAHTIKIVLDNPAVRQEMRQAGIFRSERFSWNNAANETLKVFREVIKN